MLLAVLLGSAALDGGDWWLFPEPLATRTGVINVIDRGSITKATGEQVIMNTIVILPSSSRHRTNVPTFDYLVGQREIDCRKKEYRDIWLQPFDAGGNPTAEKQRATNFMWRDIEAGSVPGVGGAMACGVFEDWEEQGFRQIPESTPESARQLADSLMPG